MPKMVNVHVTYDETKRVVSYQKGGEVQGLRHVFLQDFSDVLSSDIAPAHVKFQRYDEKFADYVELRNDDRVEEGSKVRVLITKQAKQVARSSSSEAESVIKPQYWPYCHWVMSYHCRCVLPCPDVTENGNGQPIFQRPHVIKRNTNYRLWSPVSRQNDGLIHRNTHTNIVHCSGDFNGGINSVLRCIDKTSQRTFYVSLIFKDAVEEKDYVMTGNGKGQNITALEVQPGDNSIDDKSVFEPLYYWSYTMFRNKSYNTLYLGCDNTGKTTLVENEDLDYPNPQALFVLNKYNLTG